MDPVPQAPGYSQVHRAVDQIQELFLASSGSGYPQSRDPEDRAGLQAVLDAQGRIWTDLA